jgi:hypothetical protein
VILVVTDEDWVLAMDKGAEAECCMGSRWPNMGGVAVGLWFKVPPLWTIAV